jgi:molybdenum cofactor cytidylyltransferase
LESVEVVVLAAGFSSRIGCFKPLLPYKNCTMIEQVVDTALQVASRVLLVVGHRKEAIIGLKKWAERVAFVVNEHYSRGMFSSVRAGVAQVSTPRFFIALGDQPQISAEVYRGLLAAEPAEVVLPVYQGRRGHPILLGAAVRAAILQPEAAEATVTLKDILGQFKTHQLDIDDPAIIFDVDTPEDYQQLMLAGSREAGTEVSRANGDLISNKKRASK